MNKKVNELLDLLLRLILLLGIPMMAFVALAWVFVPAKLWLGIPVVFCFVCILLLFLKVCSDSLLQGTETAKKEN